ncbi:MAG: glycosyl hydrolase [Rhizomicrobium sp.]|jgi:photosystem II stability/assembly factor-like uncharacterized protein
MKSRSFWLAAASAAILVSASQPALHAQAPGTTATVDASLYQGLHWRGIGPYRGGRALAATGVPGQPYTFYFGAVAGGVWKTTDAGQTWSPLTDHEKFDAIGAIAVAPSDPNTIYAGTGEAAPRGDMTWGNGVFKSTDGGKTWKNLGLQDTRQIGAVIVDPANPDIVLVAALGHAFGPNPNRGVYRSTDGGKSWTKVLYRDDRTGAIDVTFDPHNSQIVYASLWQALRQPWNFSSGGPGSGLYRSTDGGTTWTQLKGNGIPGGILGRIDVSVSGADSNRIYAMIEAKDGGLFRSDDAGNHWSRISSDGRLTQRAWYFSKIYADPKAANTVYALNTGLFRSTDGGKSFQLLPARHGDHHGLWIDPEDTNRLIDVSDGGATVSLDGGKSWSSQNNQPTAQFYHVSVDNQFPYNIYGAQQDNSSIGIASYNDEGAITIKDWYDVGGGECGFIVVDPRDPNVIYSDSENEIGRFDKKSQQLRIISVWPIDASGHAAKDLLHRFNWTSPLIMSPHNPDTLYVGMERVYKTSNDGQSWTPISPDLTRNDKSKQGPSGGPITHDITSVEYYDTVFAIAESPLKAGLLWVGSDDGLVHITANDGASWSDVTPRDMPQWGTVSMIEPSHFDTGTAYVAVDRHKLDDIAPHAYKTNDGGKTWTHIDAGLPNGAVVHAVREDPAKRGLLYAGTETGVFVSFDDGAHWQSLQLNLPQSPIHDLLVKGDDLVVATHGRSFWVLDDLTPLRQVNPASAQQTAILYAPEVTYRLFYPDSVDAHPPIGANPPAGAVVDYYLAAPKGEITLDVLDSNGKLVRHISSTKSTREQQPPEWPDQVEPMVKLPAQRGMNRFVWDLRYNDPVQIPGAFYEGEAPRGPLAMPGKYTLKLTAGGKVMTQTLTMKLDPRSRGSVGALEQKFELAMEAYHDQDALHRAVNDIRTVKSIIASEQKTLVGKPGSAAIIAEGNAVLKSVAPIEGTLMQVNIKGSEANLNFPGMLNEQIYAFAGLLDDSDSAPTKQELETYSDMHKSLQTQLAAWSSLRQGAAAVFLMHSGAAKKN